MALLVRVARRYIADVNPPVWMTEAVREDLLDEKALHLWRQITHLMAGHFNQDAALVYWQTKANAAGLDIPSEVLPPEREMEFEVDSRETVESWHSQSLKSQSIKLEVQKLLSGASEVPPDADSLLIGIRKQLERYDDHTSPSVEFEQDFQFLLVLIRKHLHHLGVADHPAWLNHMDQLSKRLGLLLSRAGA